MIDLITIASFSVAVPLIVGAALYRRIPGPGRWLTWLMAVWLLAELLSYVLRIRGINNWNVYALLSIAEIVIVYSLYRQIFISRSARSVCAWLAWIGIAVVITEYAYYQGPVAMVSMLYECTFFFGMGLYAFYEMIILRESERYRVINLVIMIFFLGSAVYFASWSAMKNDTTMFVLFGDAHAYLLLVCYSLFTYSLWSLQSS